MRMSKPLLLGVLLFFGTLSAPALADVGLSVIIGAPPPPHRVIVPSPRAGYVWVPGYWRWTGYSYLWIGGHWAQHRPGYYWHPPRYIRRDHTYRYHPGRWSRNRPSHHRRH